MASKRRNANLASLLVPHGETEQIRRVRVTLGLEADKTSRVALDRLRNSTLRAVELHLSNDTRILKCGEDKENIR